LYSIKAFVGADQMGRPGNSAITRTLSGGDPRDDLEYETVTVPRILVIR
jgi:hypothetical protein